MISVLKQVTNKKPPRLQSLVTGTVVTPRSAFVVVILVSIATYILSISQLLFRIDIDLEIFKQLYQPPAKYIFEWHT